MIYYSKANLPETTKWDGSDWEKELNLALILKCTKILTPEGITYRITSNDSVKSFPEDNSVDNSNIYTLICALEQLKAMLIANYTEM